MLAAALLLLPSQATGEEPRLLFRVTFDDLTANAQVAQGNPKSSLGRNLGLTAKEGFNEKTALALGDGEQCTYEIKGNLNLSVDLKALGLDAQAITAVDERTGTTLTVTGGTFTVRVRDRNYTFVSLTLR
jgi:phage tail tape-measure protein